MDVSELSKVHELHHAYLIAGASQKNREDILALLEARGIPTKGNPDVLDLSFSDVSIDDARMIARFASLNSVGAQKCIIVSFSRASTEAQNALLKVVEEAPGNSIFFFLVDASGHVLPTLRSRVVIVEGEAVQHESEEAEAFLTESYEKRLARVEKLASAVSKTQDRSIVRQFIASLLYEADKKKMDARNLRDLLDADRYLRMQGSSVKSVLGHLAVSLPRK